MSEEATIKESLTAPERAGVAACERRSAAAFQEWVEEKDIKLLRKRRTKWMRLAYELEAAKAATGGNAKSSDDSAAKNA